MNKKPLLFYGWIVLIVSFVVNFLSNGARNSFSVFYVVILDEFGWSRTSTAGIFSINLLAFGITAPIAGTLVDRFGPKKVLLVGGTILASSLILCSRLHTLYHFYLLFGVAGGIGASLMGGPVLAAVLPRWFIRRRGMAFGVLNSGGGISFLMIPLVQWLITRFGWRTSFILVGLFIGVISLPLIALFSRHKPEDMGLLPNGIHPSEKVKSIPNRTEATAKVNEEWVGVNWTLRKALTAYHFWFMFFAFFCIFGFVRSLVIVHQVALMRDAGLSNMFAASIVGLLGIMTVVGNLGGFLSDKIGREKTFTLGSLISILGLFMLLLLKKISHGWIPYLYVTFFGLGVGMETPALVAASADIFQSKNLGSIMGFVALGGGLGGIAGPLLGGFVFDKTGSYSIALVAAILVTCIALILFWAAAPRKVRRIGAKWPS